MAEKSVSVKAEDLTFTQEDWMKQKSKEEMPTEKGKIMTVYNKGTAYKGTGGRQFLVR